MVTRTTAFDYLHFTPGGKIRYHYNLIPAGEWLAIDMTVGRSRWEDDPVEWGDSGLRKLWGDKIRNAVHVYASNNKLPVSLSFVKPYDTLRVYLG